MRAVALALAALLTACGGTEDEPVHQPPDCTASPSTPECTPGNPRPRPVEAAS